MRRIFFFILMTVSALVSEAQDTLVIQDLKHMWVSVDPSGHLSPYIPGSDSELVFFELPVPEEEVNLLIRSKKPVDVWLNNKLILFQFSSSVVLDLDSAAQAVGGEKLTFRIFSEGGIDESLETNVIRLGEFQEYNLIHVSERGGATSADLYIIIISIILFLAGIYRRFFPFAFSQAVQNPLSFKVRSMSADRAYDSFSSLDNLYSVFFLGAISTLFFNYLGYDVMLFSGKGIISGVLNWLLVSLAISLCVTLKYWWIKLISFLYEFREIPNIQIQDYIRFFTLVMLIGLGLTLLDFSMFNSSSVWFRNLTVYLILFTVLFFQVWFFRKFDRFYSHRKLMIISYLCTTEFLPGFLAIYWLVKM